jgi:hypothetical protein
MSTYAHLNKLDLPFEVEQPYHDTLSPPTLTLSEVRDLMDHAASEVQHLRLSSDTIQSIFYRLVDASIDLTKWLDLTTSPSQPRSVFVRPLARLGLDVCAVAWDEPKFITDASVGARRLLKHLNVCRYEELKRFFTTETSLLSMNSRGFKVQTLPLDLAQEPMEPDTSSSRLDELFPTYDDPRGTNYGHLGEGPQTLKQYTVDKDLAPELRTWLHRYTGTIVVVTKSKDGWCATCNFHVKRMGSVPLDGRDPTATIDEGTTHVVPEAQIMGLYGRQSCTDFSNHNQAEDRLSVLLCAVDCLNVSPCDLNLHTNDGAYNSCVTRYVHSDLPTLRGFLLPGPQNDERAVKVYGDVLDEFAESQDESQDEELSPPSSFTVTFIPDLVGPEKIVQLRRVRRDTADGTSSSSSSSSISSDNDFGEFGYRGTTEEEESLS